MNLLSCLISWVVHGMHPTGLHALFSIPNPIPTPTLIGHDLGVGIGIAIGIDFFLAESCSARIAGAIDIEWIWI
jgi:hypothetical protein